MFTNPVIRLADKFLILSDLRKGAKNGADDFMDCESTYISALTYNDALQFHYICLGDSEELWENNLFAVRATNKLSVEKEKLFIQRNAFTKVFGNRDFFWDQNPFACGSIKRICRRDF